MSSGRQDAEINGDEWMERCRKMGLEVVRAEQVGAVLVLHPPSTANLPDAATLRQVADELKDRQIRYVTLGLDGFGKIDDGQENGHEH